MQLYYKEVLKENPVKIVLRKIMLFCQHFLKIHENSLKNSEKYTNIRKRMI